MKLTQNQWKAEIFHSLTMQLLYLGQRGRPDVLTAVSFLSGRVQAPDRDDYKKLARAIRYLRATQDLVLRLSTGRDGMIRWWIDASFGVHPTMRLYWKHHVNGLWIRLQFRKEAEVGHL